MRLEFDDLFTNMHEDIVCKEVTMLFLVVACLTIMIQVSTITSACYLEPEELEVHDV
jgi:hypothetical protein